MRVRRGQGAELGSNPRPAYFNCDTYSKGFMDYSKLTDAERIMVDTFTKPLHAQLEIQGAELKAMAMKLIERDKASAYANYVCGQNLDLNGVNHQLRAINARHHEALDLIAAPERPDGTYNRDRKACQQIARAALSRQDRPKVNEAMLEASTPPRLMDQLEALESSDDMSEKRVPEIVKKRHDSDDLRAQIAAYREVLKKIEAITFDSLSHSKGFIVSSIRAELSVLTRRVDTRQRIKHELSASAYTDLLKDRFKDVEIKPELDLRVVLGVQSSDSCPEGVCDGKGWVDQGACIPCYERTYGPKAPSSDECANCHQSRGFHTVGEEYCPSRRRDGTFNDRWDYANTFKSSKVSAPCKGQRPCFDPKCALHDGEVVSGK